MRRHTGSTDLPAGKRQAVFLDRDGVLNVDHGYVGSIEQLEWLPGALEAVARLTANGYLVFVVTNQSGVARGFYSESDVLALHAEMARQISESGGRVDAFAYCPHHPEAVDDRYRRVCGCRKPEPGLVNALADEYGIDRVASFLIGDKASDMEAARRAGVTGYLFGGGPLIRFVEGVLARQAARRPDTTPACASEDP